MATTLTVTPGARVTTPDGPGTVTSVDEMATGTSVKVDLDDKTVTASGSARYPRAGVILFLENLKTAHAGITEAARTLGDCTEGDSASLAWTATVLADVISKAETGALPEERILLIILTEIEDGLEDVGRSDLIPDLGEILDLV